ncbi:hypothetical protein ACO0RG_002235 [Hanseniaspora osmophila]|uniref:PEX18/PEX21 C-terminal domain-containing protein n=1 Tax=Hanseniaspora osmophila TaxID=56408 RepID=A0A1E5RHE7_9ASCO|nr:hypothetical protein AWRI3579_g1081 [Hanseniaspora osmophila]
MFVSCSHNNNPLARLNNRVEQGAGSIRPQGGSNFHSKQPFQQQDIYNGNQLFSSSSHFPNQSKPQHSDQFPQHKLQEPGNSLQWLDQFQSMSVVDPTEASDQYKQFYAAFEKQQLGNVPTNVRATSPMERLSSPPMTMMARPSFASAGLASADSILVSSQNNTMEEQLANDTAEVAQDYSLVDQELEAMEAMQESSVSTSVSTSQIGVDQSATFLPEQETPLHASYQNETETHGTDLTFPDMEAQKFQNAATSVYKNLKDCKAFQRSGFLKLMRNVSDGDVTLQKSGNSVAYSQRNDTLASQEYVGLYSNSQKKTIGPDYFSIKDHTMS